MGRDDGFHGAMLEALREIRKRLALMDPADDGERFVAQGMLGLLTDLLHSGKEVLLEAVDIVGILALKSPEMNVMVASDKELVESLLEHVSDTDMELSSAAISAVVDLSMTSEARKALHAANALDRFMFVVLWVAHIMSTRPSRTEVFRAYFQKALFAADSFLLQHPEFNLEGVSRPLLCCTYLSLRRLWLLYHRPTGGIASELTFLPSFIARLGMERLGFRYLGCSRDVIINTFLGRSDYFVKKHWEQSPALMKENTAHELIISRDFHTLSRCSFLTSFVHGSVACPPLFSDELDMRKLFEEMKENLGGPLLYDQDIRLVKSRTQNGPEEHYLQGKRRVKAKHCVKAYRAGYTVAVRGMEFRSPTVAAFCDTLGTMLGLPGIGANLYLTPADSQGLSLHYDDHCVFIVQIAGEKRWRVYPSDCSLPQLYAPRLPPDADKAPLVDILLKEGQVLYIPRGFPHQAFTENPSSDTTKRRRKRPYSAVEPCCSTETQNASASGKAESMHITFGVEVETPFTWEGFMHICLHRFFLPGLETQGEDQHLCKRLIHFGIRTVANRTVDFRKACLVAASATLNIETRSTFKALVDFISRDVGFEEACLGMTEAYMEQNDSLNRLEWLRHLQSPQESSTINVVEALKKGLDIGSCKRLFYEKKAEFVSHSVFDESAFDDACVEFKNLVEKYRTCRRKHAFGLLSLHHWYLDDKNAHAEREF